MSQRVTFTLETTLVRHEQVLTATVGQDTVLLHPPMNQYYDTGAVGGVILGALTQPMTVRALCAMLRDQYDVAPADCERDVLAFLADAVDQSIVRIVDGA